MIETLIQEYGYTILGTVITGLIGYIGVAIKAIVKKKYEDEIKERVVMNAVQMVQQVYEELPNEEKLERAVEASNEMLAIKEIVATDLEIRFLIESSLCKLKGNAFKQNV